MASRKYDLPTPTGNWTTARPLFARSSSSPDCPVMPARKAARAVSPLIDVIGVDPLELQHRSDAGDRRQVAVIEPGEDRGQVDLVGLPAAQEPRDRRGAV